jgi:hypothetical protein
MDWLAFFCVGAVLGFAIAVFTKSWEERGPIRTSLLPAVFLLVGALGLLVAFKGSTVAACPVGALTAVLCMRSDAAVGVLRTKRDGLSIALAGLQLVVTGLLVVGAIWFLLDPVILTAKIESTRLEMALFAAKAEAAAAASAAHK